MTNIERARSLLAVTQADRDCAERIVSVIRGYGVKLPNDGHQVIQEVARHRLAALLVWRPIETVDIDCVTEIDLWCESSGDGEPGWNMRGILMPGEPQWLKRDDATDYFPHENGGYFTHWRPLPAPPANLSGEG